MKILFDTGTPHPLRQHLSEHGYTVETAQYHGRHDYSNGDLLDFAEQNGFQVLITTDQNMEYELVISNWNVGIVVLTDTDWNYIKYYINDILDAIRMSQPGMVVSVEITNPQKGD